MNAPRNTLSLTTLLLVAHIGCSASSDAPSGGGSGPVYLAMSRIWDDTTTTSYVHRLPSLAGDTRVELAKALEVPGPAKLFAHDGAWFAIGDGEAPTLTRYTLDTGGALVKGDAISLANFGVDSLWDSLYFVSPEKAYYPDTNGRQLIVWNPRAMTVTGTIPLPQTVRAGYLSYYGLTPIRRGGELLFSVGWFDWLENDTVLPETGLIVLDTATDTVKRYDVDARCGGVTQAIEVASGDAYFVSSALAGAANKVGRMPSQPCALRVARAADAFDSGYALQLSTLTGGAIAGEPAPAMGDELFLRVLDEDLVTVAGDSHTWDLTGQAAWRWARWDVASNQLTEVSDLPPSTADVFWFRLDGKVFASETKTDYSETTLIDLLAAEGSRRAVTVPGFLQNIVRAR
jgi:hypothetical protein